MNLPTPHSRTRWLAGLVRAASRLGHVALSALVLAASIVFAADVAPASPSVQFSHFAPEGWALPLTDPTQVDVGPDGAIWVADKSAHVVHKLDAQGNEILTLGTGVSGSEPGQLTSPYGVAVSPDGSRVYVSEQGTTVKRIRVFTDTGAYVSEITSAGGTAFGELNGVHVDSSGRVLVADRTGKRAWMFGATGDFISSVGSSATADGALSFPVDVTVDTSGRVYIADRGNVTASTRGVRVYRSDLTYSGVKIGSGGVNTVPGAFGTLVSGVDLDAAGNVVVSDRGYQRVTRFDSLTGIFVDQWSASAPLDVTVDDQGRALTIDALGKTVQRWSPVGATAVNDAVYPTPPATPGRFSQPRRLTVDPAGNLYVADTLNNRVQKVDPNGRFVSLVSTWGAGTALSGPRAVALTSDGNLLVGDGSGRIIVYTSDLQYVSEFGSGTIGVVSGITVTPGGRVFVADSAKHCVHEFSSGGAAVSRWPADDTAGAETGDLSAPGGVAVGKDGTLWVADTGNRRIQQFTLSGTFIRQELDGGGAFSSPAGITVSGDGSLWVVDSTRRRVSRHSSVGIYQQHWDANQGIVGAVKFNMPEGIAAGPGGEIYVADTGNSRIMRAIALPPDTAPPVITVSGVPSGWVAQPASVTLSADDAGVSTPVQYSLDGSEPSLPVTSAVTVSAEGTTTLRYSSTDAAGNAAAGSAIIRIDRTAPTISHDAPEDWQATAVTVNLVATDAASGVDYVEYRLPGSEEWVREPSFTVTAEGETLVEVRAADLLGNVRSTTVPVRIDSSGIVITHNISEGWRADPLFVEFSTSGDAPLYWGAGIEGPVNLYETGILVADEGINTINFAAQRPDGILGPTRMEYVLIDRSEPWVWSDAPSQLVKGPVTVRVGADDLHSGVVYTEYRVNGGAWTPGATVLLNTEGATLLEYRAMDEVGRWSPVGSATVTIDNTAPDASDDAPQDWVNGPVTLTLSLQGEGHILYSLDGSAPSLPYDEPLAFSADKAHRVRYVARDAVGNMGPVREAFVRIDTVAPTVDHTAVPSYEGTATFSITATDMLSGPELLAYRLNDGSWVETSAATQQLRVSTVGSHTVEYRARDHAGNERTGRLEFSVTEPPPPPVDPDVVPPVTTALLDPDPLGAWSSSPVTLTLSATDTSSQVAAIRYGIDGGDGGSWETYNGPVLIDSDGSWDIEYYSVDTPGNREPVRTTTVKVDQSSPTRPGTPLASEVTTRSVHLSWAASYDVVSGVQHYRVEDEAGGRWTTSERMMTIDGLTPGAVKTFTVRAIDRAGNASPESMVSAALPYTESSAPVSLGNGIVASVLTERIAGEGAVGTARVRFGSVDVPGTVRLSRVATPPVAPPPGYRQFASGIALSFDGEVSGQRAVTIPVDSRLPAGRAANIVAFSRIDGTWKAVESFHNTVDRTLTLYPTTFATVWLFESSSVSTAARFSGTSTYRIGYGVSAPIKVRLTDAAGQALPGYTVALQRRTSGGWTRVGTMAAVSGQPGYYALSAKPYAGSRTEYRAVLERTKLYSATGSTTVVLPKAKLTKPKVPTSAVRRGARFTVSGRMYPAHRGPVKLYIERRTSSGWRPEKFVTVTSASDGTWRARTSLSKAGSWRVRATHLDSGHQASTSSASVTMAVR